MPELSIVVLSYNTCDLLRKCLDSIQSGLKDCGIDYELVVVDNNSSDGSIDMVNNEFTSVAIIRNETNEGFAKAMNRAATICQGEYILVSNSDVIYLPGSIDSMVQYLRAHPAVGIIGPQLIYPDGLWQRSYGQVPSVGAAIQNLLFITSIRNGIRRLLWPKIKIDSHPKRVGYVDGAAMLVRKEVWDILNGFDERFFFYAEDADICYRALKNGVRVIFLPQVRVIHLRGLSSTSVDLEKSVKLKLESDAKFVAKHWGTSRLRYYLLLTQIYTWTRMILSKMFSMVSGKPVKHEFRLLFKECSLTRKSQLISWHLF